MAIKIKEVLGRPTPSLKDDPAYGSEGYDLPSGILSFVLNNDSQHELITAIREIAPELYLQGVSDGVSGGAGVRIALEPLTSVSPKHGGTGKTDAVTLRFSEHRYEFAGDATGKELQRQQSEIEKSSAPIVARRILKGLVERDIITAEQASDAGYDRQPEELSAVARTKRRSTPTSAVVS